MKRGKATCIILKELRRRIAEANDIKLTIEECRYQGDCRGTCPRCEAEVAYLESQLSQRRRLGRAVILTGLSAGITGLASYAATPSHDITPDNPYTAPLDTVTTSAETDDSSSLPGVVEQMPQFPGGEQALFRFIYDNLQYPDSAAKAKIEGTVLLQFLIQKDGSIGEIKVVRSVNKQLDDEAIRVIRLLPKFIPGEMNGRPVNVWFTMPIRFRLQTSSSDQPEQNTEP